MSREKLSIKKKILQYLKYQGVSKNKFYEISGIARGTLDTDSDLTEGYIRKFMAYAPDVSLEWLFDNPGPWLKNDLEQHYREILAREPESAYNVIHRDKPTDCRELSPQNETLTVKLELGSFKQLNEKVIELENRLKQLENERSTNK